MNFREPKLFSMLVVATAVIAAEPATVASCESLASLVLLDTSITSAQSVAAGAFTLPGSRGDGSQPDTAHS
jgi:hypothetical protein